MAERQLGDQGVEGDTGHAPSRGREKVSGFITMLWATNLKIEGINKWVMALALAGYRINGALREVEKGGVEWETQMGGG